MGTSGSLGRGRTSEQRAEQSSTSAHPSLCPCPRVAAGTAAMELTSGTGDPAERHLDVGKEKLRRQVDHSR